MVSEYRCVIFRTLFKCFNAFICRYSVGDHADNSFAALGSSDLREVRLEL